MNRYSFAGKGNILLKAGSDGYYGSSSFDAEEPIAYFTNVDVEMVFASSDKIAKTGTSNILVDSKSEASIIRISNIKTTDSLQSLLYKKQVNNTRQKTIVETNTSSSSGKIYFKESGNIGTNFFIYTEDKVRYTAATVSYQEVEDTENPGNFYKVYFISGLDPNTKYVYFYSVDANVHSTFFLDTPVTPNMKLEIIIDGNLNNLSGQLFLHLNKVKLLSSPTMNFNSDSPFVDTLEFVILSDKEPIEVNYYAG